MPKLFNYFSKKEVRKRRLKRLEKSLNKIGYKVLEITWEDHIGQPPKQNETVRVTKVLLVD